MKSCVHRLAFSAKKILLLIADLVLLPLSLWLALTAMEPQWAQKWSQPWLLFVLLPLLSFPVFVRLGLYRAVLRYVGRYAFEQVVKALLISSTLLLVLAWPVHGVNAFVISLAYLILGFVLIGGVRGVARLSMINDSTRRSGVPVGIYGAGESGQHLLSALNQSEEYQAVLFLDDDETLINREIAGVTVLDPKAPNLVSQLQNAGVKEVLLALPSLTHSERKKILERLEPLPIRVRTVPTIDEILSGSVGIDQVREVQLEDLLGRDPVAAEEGLLNRCIKGKTVFVSGAGGSIGSELCRQIIHLQPKALLLLDQSEFVLYQIENELRQIMATLDEPVEIVPLLGSVTDVHRLRQIFEAYAIDTVYHAAAYKHVPLVEHNPVEGVRNNVFGTKTLAEEAARARVELFVLISTDKAVRPTNVMGASKRLAELIIQSFHDMQLPTTFCMVRFGNVLGSSGSVVPLFRRQIAQGGPVTVTHPDVTRYFMTLNEAVQLVIQAGAMAEGGDVFVLDMGQPVRIVDLALRMIRLSGRRLRDESNPERGIEIRFTGLRPGEKLHEELLIGVNVSGTQHKKIMRAEESFIPWPELEDLLNKIQWAMDQGDVASLRYLLLQGAEGYQPAEGIEDWLWKHMDSASDHKGTVH